MSNLVYENYSLKETVKSLNAQLRSYTGIHGEDLRASVTALSSERDDLLMRLTLLQQQHTDLQQDADRFRADAEQQRTKAKTRKEEITRWDRIAKDLAMRLDCTLQYIQPNRQAPPSPPCFIESVQRSAEDLASEAVKIHARLQEVVVESREVVAAHDAAIPELTRLARTFESSLCRYTGGSTQSLSDLPPRPNLADLTYTLRLLTHEAGTILNVKEQTLLRMEQTLLRMEQSGLQHGVQPSPRLAASRSRFVTPSPSPLTISSQLSQGPFDDAASQYHNTPSSQSTNIPPPQPSPTSSKLSLPKIKQEPIYETKIKVEHNSVGPTKSPSAKVLSPPPPRSYS